VPMILPPQGGKVVLIGVQATNLHACGATLTGVLRDPLSDRIRLEGRTINLEPTGDGWGGSVDGDMSTFANIPVCPNQWAASEIDGAMFELTVTITDRDGRTATETKNVTPFCSEPEFEAECTCQCQVDYMLGQECLAL